MVTEVREISDCTAATPILAPPPVPAPPPLPPQPPQAPPPPPPVEAPAPPPPPWPGMPLTPGEPFEGVHPDVPRDPGLIAPMPSGNAEALPPFAPVPTVLHGPTVPG